MGDQRLRSDSFASHCWQLGKDHTQGWLLRHAQPPEGNAAALEPSPKWSTLRAGEPHSAGVCRHPLNAGTARAALAAKIFISRNRSSSSAPAAANNTRLAFIATEAAMEIKEGMELSFCRRALGFFFTIYLFWGPARSAFKEAKQFLIYMYFISADERELHS